jgi:hypothetical protein
MTQETMVQPLPERFRSATLQGNLDALAKVNGELARRICLPVDGAHVHFAPDGRCRYELHRNLLPFDVPDEVCERDLREVTAGKEIFLFGVGLGEHLDGILRLRQEARITVWDRDPWLLRLVLMQRDYGPWIRSGRLQFTLCSDILRLAGSLSDSTLIRHPFLAPIYGNELRLLEEGANGKRGIVCAGGLFVDDVSEAFREMGFSLYTLDIRRLSHEEIRLTFGRLHPLLVFAINYTNGLSELCEQQGVDLICWEIDPAADHVQPLRSGSHRSHIFTYRRANLKEFRRAGFRHVEYLPLASDPRKRLPMALSDQEAEKYTSPLSFVGSSMIHQANAFRDIFLTQYRVCSGGSQEAAEEGKRLLEQVLSRQRQDFSAYRIPQLLVEYFSDFVEFLNRSGPHDPFMLAGEIAAAEKRINTIANLGDLGMKVWGDEGWKALDPYGIRYMGGAGHSQEINKVYCGSAINLDVNRLYQGDIVTMRVFDIMACGGFVLAEYSEELADLFEIGREVETYRTLEELRSKAAHYLHHREEAVEIAARGRRAVLERHTIAQRVGHMLEASLNNRCDAREPGGTP